jgi:hypothetical protein
MKMAPMESLAATARFLAERFGAQLNLDYVPGKTLFRDALCEELGISEAEAEALCDSLEKARLIRFDRSEELGDVWTLLTP